MRTKSAFNIAMRFLSGLRFFTQQRYAAISKAPKENPTPNDILEKSIAQLDSLSKSTSIAKSRLLRILIHEFSQLTPAQQDQIANKRHDET